MTMELKTTCAFCGQEHELASQIAQPDIAGWPEAQPGPGDSTMCVGCGQMNVFAEDGTLRAPTPKEQIELDEDSRVQHLRKAWREVRGLQ